ncbi:hypothetical protein K439DRAFT_891436 [Ramaria rubella]|nr:hypothetical protein K439DRAFT_891436 [Ramaria rubella]
MRLTNSYSASILRDMNTEEKLVRDIAMGFTLVSASPDTRYGSSPTSTVTVEARDVFHRFSIELIFETTAFSSRHTATVLCRVSKMVMEWMDPNIYRSVVISDPFQRDYFLATAESRSERHAKSGVKTENLSIADYADFSLRNYFVGLQHVHVGLLSALWDEKNLAAVSSITHLLLSHPDPGFLPLRPQLYSSITHIYFTSITAITNSVVDVLSPTNFPKLTHLVASITTDSRMLAPLQADFLTLLSPFTTLHVIGFQTFYWGGTLDKKTTLASFLEYICHKGHPKLVLVPQRRPDANEWEEWWCGSENIWEAAERLLHEQEGQK